MKSMKAPVTVYRIYDHLFRLLYVGCTGDWKRRLAQHKYHSKWFEFENCIIRRRVYDTVEAGLAVEDRAIRILQPKHNRPKRGCRHVPKRRRAPKYSKWQSYANWKQQGFPGFDVDAANSLKKGDLDG